MGFFSSSEQYTTYDLLTLPHCQLRSKKRKEYSSACPICGGFDRFRFWPDVGNYWCRQCDTRGFVSDAPREPVAPTLHDIVGSKITSKTPEFIKWQQYHANLYDNLMGQEYWLQSLGPDYVAGIEMFKLGWGQYGLDPSAVIPIQLGGRIFMVKHRLVTKSSAKYATEPSGYNATLFGLDWALPYDKVVVAEGEKKAMRLWLAGYPAVSATNGAVGFYSYPAWRVYFLGKECLVVFDPDKEGQDRGKFTASLLRGRNIVLPDKADDFINSGGNIQEYLGHPWR